MRNQELPASHYIIHRDDNPSWQPGLPAAAKYAASAPPRLGQMPSHIFGAGFGRTKSFQSAAIQIADQMAHARQRIASKSI